MTAELLAQSLLQLGLTVRRQVINLVRAGGDELARPIARVGGDMIYELDRHVEPVIERAIAAWPDEWKPLLLIAEGLNDSGRKRFGREADPLRYRLLVELLVGHDRFCGDLRPLLQRVGRHGGEAADLGLVCHSYDMAGWLVTQQAGVIVTDGFGGPLRLPLDVHHPVYWCGYANAGLQAQIQPLILAWLSQRGLKESGHKPWRTGP
jgi:hypothetical protein